MQMQLPHLDRDRPVDESTQSHRKTSNLPLVAIQEATKELSARQRSTSRRVPQNRNTPSRQDAMPSTAKKTPNGSAGKKNKVTPAGQKKPTPRETEQLQDSLEAINKVATIMDYDYRFFVGAKTDTVMVSIEDRKTGEIIREVPPEYILKTRKKIDYFVGLLVDQRR